MKNKTFVDCFMLMGTAMSLKGSTNVPEMSRPLMDEITTTFVNLSLTIRNLEIVSVKNMELEIDGMLTQKWIDPRLGSNARTRKLAVAGQIWKPKITNINGINLLDNNENTVFWRGFGDEGNVLLSEKIRLRTRCTMDFRDFPFDVQTCYIGFGSYRFPWDEVSFLWETSVGMIRKLRTNEFSLLNITSVILTEVRSSGNFSTAVIEITLKRNSTHYLICTGIPCILVVFLSYVTMWLDLSERITRFQINMIAVCVHLYFYYSTTCVLQPVPYFKALDVFVAINMAFSILSLLETLLIDTTCFAEEKLFHLKNRACTKEYPTYVYWIELGMKLGFPTCYLFFVTLFGYVYHN